MPANVTKIPMELLIEALKHPFTWGLLLGLLVAAFLWKAGFTARRNVARELKRVEAEMKNLQGHLNTHLKISASGNESLQTELEALRRQNEVLRANITALQHKPGAAEQRLLQVYEVAIRTMREQAPGFAPVWEKAIRQGEAEAGAAESGLKRLVRRVLPSLGHASTAQPVVNVTDDSPGHS